MSRHRTSLSVLAACCVAGTAGLARADRDARDGGDHERDRRSSLRFTNVTTASGFSASGSFLWFAMTQGWNDLNGDGVLDCVRGGLPGSVLLGTGNGTFTHVQQNQLIIYQSAMADIDNDGDIDLYSAYSGVFENDGTGRMTSRLYRGGVLSYCMGVAAPDFDNDGWSDLVGCYTGRPVFARNMGSSSQLTPIEYEAVSSSGEFVIPNAAWMYGTIVAADVNDDHLPDLLHADSYNGLQVMLSNDHGYRLRRIGEAERQVYYAYANCTPADIDNDGDLDIFDGSGYHGGHNGMLMNMGEGEFEAVSDIVPDAEARRWNGAAMGDLDNDGDIDIVLRSMYGSDLEVRLNNGTERFRPIDQDLGSTNYPFDVRLVDYDNDGDLDIAVSGLSSGALYRNETNNDQYLKVRVIGAGDGATNKAGVGAVVTLHSAATGQLLGRRDVLSTDGMGAGPFWLHFGGVTPTSQYIVRVEFASGTVEKTVVPALTSSVFGSRTIPQMVTISEEVRATRRVLGWRETDQEEVIAAALRAELRRRGQTETLASLRAAGRDSDVRQLLAALGARNPEEALGQTADVVRSLQLIPSRN